MAKLNTYKVLSRIRRNGKVYEPGDEIDLSKIEATRLKALGCCIEYPPEEVDEALGALADTLRSFIDKGHDVKSMNMSDLGKLLGEAGRGVKRPDVDAALKELDQSTKE